MRSWGIWGWVLTGVERAGGHPLVGKQLKAQGYSWLTADQ